MTKFSHPVKLLTKFNHPVKVLNASLALFVLRGLLQLADHGCRWIASAERFSGDLGSIL
jgi:hypothetical protein